MFKISSLRDAFIHLLYPPQCIHCHSHLEKGSHLLCQSCSSLLGLINFEERCPYCFVEVFSEEISLCDRCKEKRPFLNRVAAAFDYVGPAASLIRGLKYAHQPYLAKGIGAYLTAQFFRLGWPMPDVIVPVPISASHWVERGYNQSLLLAKEVSEMLKVPLREVLSRQSGDYSQAGLKEEQRMHLTEKSFCLKEGHEIQDKSLLLIDDVMTTGATVKRCAQTLLGGYPTAIYGLTVCRALK